MCIQEMTQPIGKDFEEFKKKEKKEVINPNICCVRKPLKKK